MAEGVKKKRWMVISAILYVLIFIWLTQALLPDGGRASGRTEDALVVYCPHPPEFATFLIKTI